jgi:ribosomal protein L32
MIQFKNTSVVCCTRYSCGEGNVVQLQDCPADPFRLGSSTPKPHSTGNQAHARRVIVATLAEVCPICSAAKLPHEACRGALGTTHSD